MIFVPTVQHTGTWFTLEFLKKIIDGSNLYEAKTLCYEMPEITRPAIVHAHFPTPETKLKQPLSVEAIRTLVCLYPTVIPIRNPMLSILTGMARAPHQRQFYIVDGFVELSKWYKYSNVCLLPIDSPGSQQDILGKVAAHVGVTDKEDVIREVASAWIPVNSTPGLWKRLYQEGKYEILFQLLGPKIAEVQYLFNMHGAIDPMMRDAGYDDIWDWVSTFKNVCGYQA